MCNFSVSVSVFTICVRFHFHAAQRCSSFAIPLSTSFVLSRRVDKFPITHVICSYCFSKTGYTGGETQCCRCRWKVVLGICLDLCLVYCLFRLFVFFACVGVCSGSKQTIFLPASEFYLFPPFPALLPRFLYAKTNTLFPTDDTAILLNASDKASDV